LKKKPAEPTKLTKQIIILVNKYKKEQFITVGEFCEHTGIKEEEYFLSLPIKGP
jgi:hypothetical protein